MTSVEVRAAIERYLAGLYLHLISRLHQGIRLSEMDMILEVNVSCLFIRNYI